MEMLVLYCLFSKFPVPLLCLSLSLSLTIVPNCKAVHTSAPRKKESDYFLKIESKLQCHAHGSVQLAPCLQRVALSSI